MHETNRKRDKTTYLYERKVQAQRFTNADSYQYISEQILNHSLTEAQKARLWNECQSEYHRGKSLKETENESAKQD